MTHKILVIDDDVTALDIVDLLFEEEGYEVTRRSSGELALEALETLAPDVIVIDLMMPHMNGQECVRQIRRRGLKMPILAFTALDDAEVHREACEAGCNSVLTKPCKSSVLLKKIEALVA
jgi:CheY-like chemotaxis protein